MSAVNLRASGGPLRSFQHRAALVDVTLPFVSLGQLFANMCTRVSTTMQLLSVDTYLCACSGGMMTISHFAVYASKGF